MITPDLIAAQPTTITAQSKNLIILFLRKSPLFQLQMATSATGDDSSTKIDNATDIQKQMLNAALVIINQLGSNLVSIQRDEDALVYSVKENLIAIADEIFYILYANDPSLIGAGPIQPGQGLFGQWAAVGQRGICYPSNCTCGLTACTCLPTSKTIYGTKPKNWLDIGCR